MSWILVIGYSIAAWNSTDGTTFYYSRRTEIKCVVIIFDVLQHRERVATCLGTMGVGDKNFPFRKMCLDGLFECSSTKVTVFLCLYAALCRERCVTQTKCIFLLYLLIFYTCIGAVYFIVFIHMCIKSMSIVYNSLLLYTLVYLLPVHLL